MFGRMTMTPLVRLDAGKHLEVAVAELLVATEYPQIARWIQFQTAVALFLVVTKDPKSGAIAQTKRTERLTCTKRLGGRPVAVMRKCCGFEHITDLCQAEDKSAL